MLNVDSLKSFLESQMPAALEMLRQMVAINSYTANREGVNRLGRLTAECFKPLGFGAEFVPCAERRFGDMEFTRRYCRDALGDNHSLRWDCGCRRASPPGCRRDALNVDSGRR